MLARSLPLVLAIVCTCYLAIRWRVHGAEDLADWVALVLALWTVAFYPKYLARPDVGHALEANNMTLPLAAFLFHRLFDPVERACSSTRGRSAGAVYRHGSSRFPSPSRYSFCSG